MATIQKDDDDDCDAARLEIVDHIEDTEKVVVEFCVRAGASSPLKSKTDASALKNRYPQNDSMIKAAKGGERCRRRRFGCFVKPGDIAGIQSVQERYREEFFTIVGRSGGRVRGDDATSEKI